jgi:hypothetical protein
VIGKIRSFQGPRGMRGAANLQYVKALQPAFDGLRELVPRKRCEAYQRPKAGDQRIALIFHVQFEWLRRKDRRASRRPGISLRKGQRRAFEQKDSPGPSAAVTRQPKAVLVAADEECRDRRI